MGIFDETKSRVTKEEWIKVRSSLSIHNFTEKEINRIEEIFRGDMDDEREIDKGIDEYELEQGLTWMRQHISQHMIPENKIDILEKEMRERING